MYAVTYALCVLCHFAHQPALRCGDVQVSELESLVEDAHKKNVNPRALVIINPGNPTGQCLAESNMQEVIDFCRRRGIVLLADEVYQARTLHTLFNAFLQF
jgi:aspartate/methionine/tyrosine aminotransferase